MNFDFFSRAESLIPTLYQKTVPAVNRVEAVGDSAAFQNVSMRTIEPAEAVFIRWNGKEVEYTFDFGRYCVGYLSIGWSFDRKVDSPLRVRFRFGESPAEMASDFDRYTGHLGRGWLQEEIVVLDHPAPLFSLPRRYAFRYLAIRVEGSPNYRFRIDSLEVEDVTSADRSTVTPLNEIDRISLNTLSACMQEVFEDGPKRDRRLWLGDLRFQALANYATYRNNMLVKRCLYLFAAFARADGAVPSDVYRKCGGDNFIYDYLGLFPVALLEYLEATGDEGAAHELYPTARRQLELMLAEFDDAGEFRNRSSYWLFIDWSESLDRNCAEFGVTIFALRAGAALAEKLRKYNEADEFLRQAEKLTCWARTRFFRGTVFLSGGQYSWASQIWMALAEVPGGADALRFTLDAPEALKPGGPYLYSYAVEALQKCGYPAEANRLLEEYWGTMAQYGFDTYPEVFDSSDSFRSPYGDFLVNSFCHAWSCTPAYFLRRNQAFSNVKRLANQDSK